MPSTYVSSPLCFNLFSCALALTRCGAAFPLRSAQQRLGTEGRERGLKRYVVDVRVVKKQSIWGYHFGEMTDFLKITVALPSLVATARGYLSKGMMIGGQQRVFMTYESNLLYVLRFMVDKKIVGGTTAQHPTVSPHCPPPLAHAHAFLCVSGAWLELKGGTYKVRGPQQKKSYSQLEVDIHTDTIIAHEPVGVCS
jgi:hypothetical protein